MAEENEAQTAPEIQETPQSAVPTSGGIMQLLIPIVIVIVLTAAGFILGRVLGGKSGPQEVQAATEPEPTEKDEAENLLVDPASDKKGWYYDLEPVATNLNEPGATRYVRVLLTLEMSSKVEQQKGTQFLDERKPIMINLLNIYFAGLSIEDLNSDKDMRRIQTELLDIFNENLYSGSQPLIKKILFKEFGVQ